MTKNDNSKFNKGTKTSSYFFITDHLYDCSTHPLVKSTASCRSKLSTLLSYQETQILDALVEALQVDRQMAVRIALYELRDFQDEQLKVYLHKASPESIARGHTSRDYKLDVKLSSDEKSYVVDRAREMSVSDKTLIRLAIIHLRALVRVQQVDSLSGCKRLEQDDIAVDWSESSKGKPKSGKTDALKEKGPAMYELKKFRSEIEQVERDIIKEGLGLEILTWKMMLERRYPHYPAFRKQELKRMIKAEIDLTIELRQREVIERIGKKEGMTLDQINQIDRHTAMVFLAMDKYDLDRKQGEWWVKDDEQEWQAVEALPGKEILKWIADQRDRQKKLQTQHVLDQERKLELWIAEREAAKTPEQKALEAEQKQQFLEHQSWVDIQMKKHAQWLTTPQGFPFTEEAQRLRNLADESMWEDPDRPDVEFLFSYDDPDRLQKLEAERERRRAEDKTPN